MMVSVKAHEPVGALRLRPIIVTDLPQLMGLVEQVGWNQQPRDWLMLMRLAPEACLAMVAGDRVVGTATGVGYNGQVGWIGMVIVDVGMRRMGVASRLLAGVLERLEAFPAIKLDATPDGSKVYERIGFVPEYPLTRWAVESLARVEPDGSVTSCTGVDWAEIIAFDQSAFGVERADLLRCLAGAGPHCAAVIRDGKGLAGFCLGRRGRTHTQIGPVEARDVTGALRLFDTVTAPLAGQPVTIDVLDGNREFGEGLRRRGFLPRRTLVRMVRGTNAWPGVCRHYFAVAGYELG